MNYLIDPRKIFLTMLFIVPFLFCMAGGKDSSIVETIASGNSTSNNNAPLNSARKFSDLDKYVYREFISTPAQSEFNQAFFDRFNTADSSVEVQKMKAQTAINDVSASNSFVDYLSPSDINKLPIGLKKKIGNTDVTIAVSSAIFTPTYAELTVFARIEIPQSQKKLFFGVKGLKLSYTGGIIGDARLVLLGDLAIPIQGNNSALVLKGGSMNTSTGQMEGKTYVSIDCKGFKGLGIEADIEFSRSLIIPVNQQGEVIDGRVKASIAHLEVNNWNDIIAAISFKNNFQLNGLKGMVFNVTNAVFDFSDLHNDLTVVYPQGYQQKYLQQSAINTWRGVYVKNLSISLPKAFKDKTDPTRLVTFGVNDLIIDNNGITGIFYGANILPITKGKAANWKFSVDSIRLELEANHLTRAGFGGRIGLPLSTGYDTTNKRKFLAYSAVITASSDYLCRVTSMDSVDFDLWKAKVVLYPNSYIQLSGNQDAFKPEAMLHGKMGILAKSKTESEDISSRMNPIAEMNGIEFQGLHITTDAPFISAQYFGYKGEIKANGFPVSVSEIALTKIGLADNEIGIGLNVKVNLHENEFSGSSRMVIVGRTEEDLGILSWKFNRVEVKDVEVHADFKEVFKLDGYVSFLDNGEGFKGRVLVEFKTALDKVKINVGAMFGKKPTFRYWYFDAAVDLGSVGSGTQPINIKGFGGGAYFRVKKDGYDPAFSETGIKYTPDSTAGLGIKAAVMFNVGTDAAANGTASFEIAFNKGGGLRYIGLFGFVKIMDNIKIPDGMQKFISGQIQKIEQKLSQMDNAVKDELEKLKLTDPTKAAEKTDVNDEKPGEQGISAYIGIQYDFNAKTFHANFDMYINAAGGLLKGVGANNRAGWAEFHSSPDKAWHLYIGTPSDPIGVRLGIAGISITTTAYLMVGHDIPAFPAPPQQVTDILGLENLQYTANRNQDDLSNGRGFAFGAKIGMNTGDIRFLIFYANFAAGLGFDVMIKDYGDAHCEGSTDRIGFNGWYAQGQAYAYLHGELGVRIKLAFIRKNISIIRGDAAALLQAKLPNPTWIGGAMAFNVDILGGLLKGRFNFKFSFGNDCQLVSDSARDEEIKIVEQLTPDDKATNASVFAAPTASFRIKPGEVMEATNENGETIRLMPELESFKLYLNNDTVAVDRENTYATSITLRPQRMLNSYTDYSIKLRLVFKEYRYDKWIDLLDNGQKVVEEKIYTFKTGFGPDSIPYSNIQNMYPAMQQKFFYRNESTTGFITLKTDQSQLFNAFNTFKVKFVNKANGSVSTLTTATYNATDKRVNFDIPALSANSTYEMIINGEGPRDQNVDATRPIIRFTFSTSQYGTLAEKLSSLTVSQHVIARISSDAVNLQAVLNGYEGFELSELTPGGYTGNKALIEVVADTSDSYYKSSIRPLIYPSVPFNDGTNTFSFSRSDAYGLPPLKAVIPLYYYVEALRNVTGNDFITRRLPFVYELPRYYLKDFIDLKTKVINKYVGATTTTTYTVPVEQSNWSAAFEEEYSYTTITVTNSVSVPELSKKLIEGVFPVIPKGNYKVKLQYVLPDGRRGTSGEFVFSNPIE